MKNENLNNFVQELSKNWGELSSSLTLKTKQLLEELGRTCLHEDWYLELVKDRDPAKQIYKSEEHGFVLMGHVEGKDEISPPHDHGNGWVLYLTVEGQVNMGIFHKIIRSDGSLQLVQKDEYPLKAGQCCVYLPGDIHHTHAKEDTTVTLRLTSCDFNDEVKEGRLVRFMQPVNKW